MKLGADGFFFLFLSMISFEWISKSGVNGLKTVNSRGLVRQPLSYGFASPEFPLLENLCSVVVEQHHVNCFLIQE